MRILIVSDAWFPQVNGVVRALSTVRDRLQAQGHETCVIGPDRFRTLPCPTYPEIRLSLTRPRRVGDMIADFRPDAVHIATEGPLGWCARHWLGRRGLPFTTSFHTMFPAYLKLRAGIPERWCFALIRRFHQAGVHVMCSTGSLEGLLARHGIRRTVRWIRGVDEARFRPAEPARLGLPRPILAYVGRLAVEKNLEAFLDLETPGSKVLVGDGPARANLESRYPQAHFLGERHGEELVAHYCAADVLVFPSRTDTLGLVMLEAMACGTPVAAFPTQGPLDVVADSGAGVLDDNLGKAIQAALEIAPEACLARARQFSWDVSAQQFLGHLAPLAAEAPMAQTATAGELP